jgi:hypothetical protein
MPVDREVAFELAAIRAERLEAGLDIPRIGREERPFLGLE